MEERGDQWLHYGGICIQAPIEYQQYMSKRALGKRPYQQIEVTNQVLRQINGAAGAYMETSSLAEQNYNDLKCKAKTGQSCRDTVAAQSLWNASSASPHRICTR